MQFHLNGFKPGNPELSEAAERGTGPDALPNEVDVLIVGCGPAGLTLAAQCRFPLRFDPGFPSRTDPA